MQKLLLFLLMPLFLASCRAEKDQPEAAVELARNGKTAYVIALAADAIPAEKTAASQLQKYLQQVTGATFVIKPEAEAKGDEPQILIGAGPRVRALLPKQNWDALGDGIVIQTVGNKLILAGGRPRGTLYAVYQFLEDTVGCRWWTPTESLIPRNADLSVPAQNIVYKPPFDYREHFTGAVMEDPVFATALRENGHFQRQTAEWGGHYSILGWCHTFRQLLPPDTYFKQHPEWYSDPTRGYRPGIASSPTPHGDETQLCLSNPEVVEEISKNALAWIAKNPEAGYISIAQNDGRDSFCRCPACVKLEQAEGSISGPVVKFVNAVAQKIAVKYPDFLIETLAYQRTQKPPKTIRPAKNVIIRFAPIDTNFGYPYDSKQNQTVKEDLEGWSKLSPRLFVWNYVTNFQTYWLPHPNWSGLGADLRLFADNKVTGVFEQGDPYSKGLGDFVQLRAWLISKLLWNPNLDQKELTAEFMQGYYGNAAPFLKQYLNVVQQSFIDQNRMLSQDNVDLSYLTLQVMNEGTRLFDQAEAAVKDDKQQLHRVQRQRLSHDLAWIYRYKKLKEEADAGNKEFLGPEDPLRFVQEFPETAKQLGDDMFTKGGAFPNVVPRLETIFTPAADLPEFAKAYPAGDVIDFQQKDFYLYRKGELSSIVDDASASDGKTARLAGDTGAWAVQAPLSWFFEGKARTKWHVYAYVRVPVDGDAALQGNAVTCGIYDKEMKKDLQVLTPPLQDIAGEEYQRIDMGTHDLGSESYVYFAATLNPVVKDIYIDRVILIRQK